MDRQLSLAVVLFDDFELLDVFGPLEMFGMYPEQFSIHLVAEKNTVVTSAQGPRSVLDHHFSDEVAFDILLVPGGRGTRVEVENPVILAWLQAQSKTAQFVTSVCTGSALLAKAGLLDGRRATGNKLSFSFVESQGPDVDWQKQARWVEDGHFFTSSGVSAGIDMSLALIENIMSEEAADQAATWAEYEWHKDPRWDPFAKIHGLV